MRLQGGIDHSNGRVEFCEFNTWGAVCNDEWDDNDARVVCKQLGYNNIYGTFKTISDYMLNFGPRMYTIS